MTLDDRLTAAENGIMAMAPLSIGLIAIIVAYCAVRHFWRGK
jgi:hypothetical protein